METKHLRYRQTEHLLKPVDDSRLFSNQRKRKKKSVSHQIHCNGIFLMNFFITKTIHWFIMILAHRSGCCLRVRVRVRAHCTQYQMKSVQFTNVKKAGETDTKNREKRSWFGIGFSLLPRTEHILLLLRYFTSTHNSRSVNQRYKAHRNHYTLSFRSSGWDFFSFLFFCSV